MSSALRYFGGAPKIWAAMLSANYPIVSVSNSAFSAEKPSGTTASTTQACNPTPS